MGLGTIRGAGLIPLFSVREVAQRIGYPTRTTLRYIHEGKFDTVFRLKQAYRVPESAIQTFITHYGRKEPRHDE